MVLSKQVLLPSYSILDGAQALLEMHKIGNRLVGRVGVKALLPGEQCYHSYNNTIILCAIVGLDCISVARSHC